MLNKSRLHLDGEVSGGREKALAADSQAQHGPQVARQALVIARDDLCAAVQPQRAGGAVRARSFAEQVVVAVRIPYPPSPCPCGSLADVNCAGGHTCAVAGHIALSAHVEGMLMNGQMIKAVPGMPRDGRCTDHGRLATSAAPVEASRQRATSSRRAYSHDHYVNVRDQNDFRSFNEFFASCSSRDNGAIQRPGMPACRARQVGC